MMTLMPRRRPSLRVFRSRDRYRDTFSGSCSRVQINNLVIPENDCHLPATKLFTLFALNRLDQEPRDDDDGDASVVATDGIVGDGNGRDQPGESDWWRLKDSLFSSGAGASRSSSLSKESDGSDSLDRSRSSSGGCSSNERRIIA